ncbi:MULTISPECIES: (deoxy)nucleoside triphosphate pyrophosphohydrolase [Arthrobacter]|uniref:8-oxo-dGTP diphosphatase n=1 Tax=Arthrobacter terricola TaxID=2547396 RepID=A0A4R5L1E4_9MICC|nr:MULTISPECIES: (deoxy)nucleoside triphosphate pyrophosphohydrolase [Arthrobacter]MBT8160211.1 (deoxy)nucleoside triphosphate pyrophosphohydrolase [Arthrobacter sp. GN70]TDG01201.1 (deoxy)nucleoside triphosphate pyrophosphohydrolase [Arthrobacter terricola]
MTALISVAGAAVVDSLDAPTRLLVARRSAPPQFAGMWEFPGGKLEAGETFEAALHRELLEELGIAVRLGAEVESDAGPGWPLNERAVMRVWFAEVLDGEPRPLQDHDELRWVPLGNGTEAFALPWIPADLPIVRALLARVDSGLRS